jgi:NADPH:quinone reductase-like Zn-dependent oxidoreductase
MVGAQASLKMLGDALKVSPIPGFLGGGKRTRESFLAKATEKDLAEIGQRMEEGKVKTVIDSRWKFEETTQAFEILKTGRAKGKVVIEVA